MLNKFEKYLNKNLPFLKEKKLLLTVSGGIDSVILTHLLHKLNYNISIAHCNFCLRGKDSDNDQQFVQNLAKTLNIPFFITHFDTQKYSTAHKLSIQEAARNLRYDWFNKVLAENKLNYILTAHNLNDSLETFLINLSRGTGLKGFLGIPPVNQKVVRPLLTFSRKEITTFALENNIQWQEDKSNANTKYTRNKIRHQIIPVLQEINPNLLESFQQTLENLQGSANIVKNSVEEKINKIQNKKGKTTSKVFNVSELKKLKNTKAYIHEIFAPYNFTNFDDIVNLLSAQSGKQLFSKTHRLIKDRDFLLLEELREENQVPRTKSQEPRTKNQEVRDMLINENDFEFNIQNLTFNIQHSKPNIQNSTFKTQNPKPKTFSFDKTLLKFPLIVRKWQKSDYFYPLGMQGKKKLSKYFKDEKMSLLEKENIWLLLSDNKIVWVIGKRQDERFKITETTTQIMQITSLSTTV